MELEDYEDDWDDFEDEDLLNPGGEDDQGAIPAAQGATTGSRAKDDGDSYDDDADFEDETEEKKELKSPAKEHQDAHDSLDYFDDDEDFGLEPLTANKKSKLHGESDADVDTAAPSPSPSHVEAPGRKGLSEETKTSNFASTEKGEGFFFDDDEDMATEALEVKREGERVS